MSKVPRPFGWRRMLAMMLAAVTVAIAILYPHWLAGGRARGQQPAEPFRIAGNF